VVMTFTHILRLCMTAAFLVKFSALVIKVDTGLSVMPAGGTDSAARFYRRERPHIFKTFLRFAYSPVLLRYSTLFACGEKRGRNGKGVFPSLSRSGRGDVERLSENRVSSLQAAITVQILRYARNDKGADVE